MGDRIYVFARPPVEGRVKTRLAAGVGAAAAARLYRAFLLDVLGVCEGVGAEVVVSAAEAPDHPALAEVAPAHRRVGQAAGDLGARIAGAFREAAEEGARRVMVLGSDHPVLTRAALRRCLDLAEADTAVLGPADDGGFWCLVGPAGERVAGALPGIAWSTARTRAETEARLRAAGLQVRLGPPTYDVDEAEDLGRLAADLSRLAPERAPETRRVMASLARRW